MNNSRREFLKKSALAAGGAFMLASSPGLLSAGSSSKSAFDFKISLAEWSLNKQIFGGELDNLNFPVVAKEKYGISAVEYVNQFFADKAKDKQYLQELKFRADASGVESVLIMVDNEGLVAVQDDAERTQAVENHYKWIDAAAYLGCHAIRINLFGSEKAENNVEGWISAGTDGLSRLAEYGAEREISVVVENHGGLSSHAGHLTEVMRQVDSEYAGTLPDFGNFCIRRENNERWGDSCAEQYDTYKGVKELMPFAKGVSAKTYAFDEDGNESSLDYKRLLTIVKESGWSGGYIGVEYEGDSLSAENGIIATRRLLERLREELG
ncbi:sugar phosphate isomerase/epimerase family protein [Gracilimonas mengyeensis]|uniref:Tat (Twin-arginine translocation) pathway signal sequence n=1 Tax=Gracilimonas mengyeensis TaxID=1302730 RepID=A0A521BV79_9BACT|nr:TIM barrel protein [Gracilimonas mengyeensis]SMO51077.1 Tat (twin-arginine translocation) pathway signal sequence [Gracilimonas mengyeensis]